MRSLAELKRKLKTHIDDIKRKYEVKEMAIFGSYAKGEAKEESDIDILVDFEEIPDMLTFLELEIYLEEILGVKVDLVRKQALRREIKERVLKEAIRV